MNELNELNDVQKMYVMHWFDETMAYIADARLIAGEREFHGVYALLNKAIANLDLIGKLTGINGQKRIEGGQP